MGKGLQSIISLAHTVHDNCNSPLSPRYYLHNCNLQENLLKVVEEAPPPHHQAEWKKECRKEQVALVLESADLSLSGPRGPAPDINRMHLSTTPWKIKKRGRKCLNLSLSLGHFIGWLVQKCELYCSIFLVVVVVQCGKTFCGKNSECCFFALRGMRGVIAKSSFFSSSDSILCLLFLFLFLLFLSCVLTSRRHTYSRKRMGNARRENLVGQ